MACIVDDPLNKPVREFRIQIDDEFVSCRFGKEIPREEAMQRIQAMLSALIGEK